jgi:hypothetical protein
MHTAFSIEILKYRNLHKKRYDSLGHNNYLSDFIHPLTMTIYIYTYIMKLT